MTTSARPSPIELLEGLHAVLSLSLLEIAGAFSAVLAPMVEHGALVIFTEDCTGRPQKKAGDKQIIEAVSIAELDVVRAGQPTDGSALWAVERTVGGAPRQVAVWMARTGALLVLTDPVLTEDTVGDDVVATIGSAWELVALSIRHQVGAAPPAYLVDSRATSTERTRVIAEMTEAHATTLESLLAVLRSRTTSDAAARQVTADLAAAAMVQLRAVSDRDRVLSEEPVARAFERLRDDLRPLVRFGDLDVQFVEPPVSGRALPGEVAHAGRAIVRGAVLALVEQPNVGRVRVQWDCDGSNLLINIRDDGPGDLSEDDPSLRQLTARVAALEGSFSVAATAGWGSELDVSLPLDAPQVASSAAAATAWGLSAREQEVLQWVATGARNRRIAEELSISENTVKFHVARLLRKVGATTRAELAAITR
ncbi:regulatory LuxR family protein [Glaciihabitans tibetensis]|uniref:Regulatory LuxR family protein n=1 Tax=Glaciihabitans tibetensis TaxID=1266600 RepID=A0A2T0VCJ3_9MICO|nr:LuxR C-terminal-related transcriptional regulator [Glaciihabitans tibetensis]PRY67898.1 regulatory LuxR family protein [Glaciihabitans tibetensis]